MLLRVCFFLALTVCAFSFAEAICTEDFKYEDYISKYSYHGPGWISEEFAWSIQGASSILMVGKGLRALGEEFPHMRKIVVCNEPRRREVAGVSIIPVNDFLREYGEESQTPWPKYSKNSWNINALSLLNPHHSMIH